jgi:uncharacterized caspase-like protein
MSIRAVFAGILMHVLSKSLLATLVVCAAILALSLPACADRFVLVIGNSEYQNVAPLLNPGNDANDIGAAFADLGYDVTFAYDLTRSEMLDILRDFRRRAVGSDQAIIYYAGHGIEIDNQNFMIPVDATLATTYDVEYEAMSLDLLVGAVAGASGLQLVVIDACRNNPFSARMVSAGSTRSIGRGLAQYEPAGNSLVAYAARGGTVALDGSDGNSPYAEAFLNALAQPNLEIGRFFREVRDSVVSATAGMQEPFLYGSLSASEFFFHTAEPLSAAPAAIAPVSGMSLDLEVELEFWRSVRDSNNADGFRDYLERYPHGTFVSIAERWLGTLAPETSSPENGVSVGSLQSSNTPDALLESDNLAASEPVDLSTGEIREVQERLNVLGFDAGVEDGLIGPRTRRAIVEFQTETGIPPNETIDTSFMSAIRSAVSEAQLTAHREERERRLQAAARARATAAQAAAETATQQLSEETTTQPTSQADEAARLARELLGVGVSGGEGNSNAGAGGSGGGGGTSWD